MTRGDSRIAMTIARNADTVKFGRENRFLIDDPSSGDMLAYLLTKPLKVGKTYNNAGVYSFVLQEVVSTKDDNMSLGIADYYKHFPRENSGDENIPDNTEAPNQQNDNGRKVWL